MKDELTSFRENISVAVIRVWVTGAVQMALSRPDLRDECNAVQVKYTNQKRIVLMNDAGSSIHAIDQMKPCFFWIKSSARRAFGGCLGSKRR